MPKFGRGGYYLDVFDIPDSLKILYYQLDNSHLSHVDIQGIPKSIKEKVIILSETEQNGAARYNGLHDIEFKGKDIYLNGYFFDHKKYHGKYWQEIRKSFSLKYNMQEIDAFKNLIKDKVSVGVHIRRGDMLLADWSTKMTDDFYRGAVALCRRKLGDCIFCVFSDDIDYARKILGKDTSIYYIHFLGSYDAAVIEFICLSFCNHRILSNSSTYSRLANELSDTPGKRAFCQYGKDRRYWITKKIRRMFWGINDTESLDYWDIKKWNGKYQNDGKENINDYKARMTKILSHAVTADNCREVLGEICTLSCNVYDMSSTDELKLAFQKFLALIEAEEYESALMISTVIYEIYADDINFRCSLVKALLKSGAVKEAELESRYKSEGKKHFLIIPAGKSYASSKIYGLVELGIALHHLGHTVSYIFDPMDSTEKWYIKNNKRLTSRRGICCGGFQYLLEDVERQGIQNFIEGFEGDELYIITRKQQFCGLGAGEIKPICIFPDYSDWRDAEKMPDQKEADWLYEKADIILTRTGEKSSSKEQRVIQWEDKDHQEAYWVKKERFNYIYSYRLGERIISMAMALVDAL